MKSEKVNRNIKTNAKSMCNAKLEFVYSSHKLAESVDKATRQDNEGFVTTEIKGNKIVATINAEKITSLLHTMDDYLECLRIAEIIISGQRINKLETK